MKNIALGKNGEEIAKKYLENQGYKILETNRRFSRYCEIDIIALDKDTVVFCEVKTRKTNACGTPLEAITRSKFENIKKGLFYYRSENPQYKLFRIDVIGITIKPEIQIKHLKNVSFG